MEEKHKKVLSRCLPDFIDSLNLDDVLPYLLSEEMMSKSDYEKLTSFHTTAQKVTNFIFSLQSKGPKAFHCFIEALKQHHIYAHLQSKLHDYLNEYEKGNTGMNDKWQWTPMRNYQNYAIDQCKELINSQLPVEAACNHFLNLGLLKVEFIDVIRDFPEQSRSSFLMEYVKGKGVVAYELLLDFLTKSHPDLERKIRESEKMMKEKEERFQRLVTFTFKHDKLEDYPDLPHQLNVILIGKTGSGKSSTGNTIVGENDVFLEVIGSDSGTKTVQKEVVKVGNFEINLLDTPGLFDTSSTLSNKDILLEIMKTAQEFAEGVHVFLFVCRGDVRFTKEEMKTFNEIQEYFGKDLLKHCLLVMTHADSFLEVATLQEHLQKNKELRTLFENASKHAIAVANKCPENSLIYSETIRAQLIHAIVDKVSYNKCKPFSGSIFEATRKELEKERLRSKVKEKINWLTFQYLTFRLPSKAIPQTATEVEPSESDIKLIISDLSDSERSPLSRDDLRRVVKIYLKDHIDFIQRLLKTKSQDQKVTTNIKGTHCDEEFPENIWHHILKCFQSFPVETKNKLRAGEGLSEEEINMIIDRSRVEKVTSTKTQQSALLLGYIDMFVDAYRRQSQRHELIESVHSECNTVIKQYFISKSTSERSDIIHTFIKKGYIPPDLHCLCWQVLPDKFKSNSSWDTTVEEFLFETVVDRLNTENHMIMSIIEILKRFRKVNMLVAMFMLPVLVTGNVFVTASMVLGGIATAVVWKAYEHRKSRIPIIHCNECGGRHRDKGFKPIT